MTTGRRCVNVSNWNSNPVRIGNLSNFSFVTGKAYIYIKEKNTAFLLLPQFGPWRKGPGEIKKDVLELEVWDIRSVSMPPREERTQHLVSSNKSSTKYTIFVFSSSFNLDTLDCLLNRHPLSLKPQLLLPALTMQQNLSPKKKLKSAPATQPMS